MAWWETQWKKKSARQETKLELNSLGFYDEDPPDWFRERMEQAMLQSIVPETLREMWEEYRNPIISETKATSTDAGDEDELSDDEFLKLLQ